MKQFVTNQKSTPALEAVGWGDLQLEIHRDILDKAAELQRNVDEKRQANRSGVPTSYAVNSYVVVEYPKTMGDGRGR
jgi:hypothetical protein